MSFSLNTKIIGPEENNSVNSAVILLHGYGGDGEDISMLTLNWKRFLPKTVFLCPNGHQTCPINPIGFQWFDLSQNDPKYLVEESQKAEKKISNFIEEVKDKYKLKNKEICLSGFSQGCMISINLGLTAKENFNSIVGFSGKIIDKNDIMNRIKSKTKMLLLHGDQDEVVPSENLLDVKDFLLRNNVEVETHLLKNCGHNITTEASSIALRYIKKNFYL